VCVYGDQCEQGSVTSAKMKTCRQA